MPECSICGTDSEYSWRCSECGKLFDGDEGSGDDNRAGHRGATA